ncbi:MAG: transglutaminase-like domain-containing protein [Stellaceae bacterium]
MNQHLSVLEGRGGAEPPEDSLRFYLEQSAMTSPGHLAELFDSLPRDVAGLAAIVLGLLLHEHIASSYGVTLTDARRAQSHLRSVMQMLDRILARDGRPLSAARPLGSRLVGVCRHFTVMAVAMLRSRGIPARGRCGFASYFERGKFWDHWVCEYWNAGERRWVRMDAQLDAHQRALFKTDFDPLDVPLDRFLSAGEAWTRCRAGKADPSKFGILDMRGLWFIAGNVLRDVAALNTMEMLPWDVWGAMPRDDGEIDDERLALCDRLAALARTPDDAFGELRALYGRDSRVRVPATVFNAIRQRQEVVPTA